MKESSKPLQAVILCGGRGERLRPLTDNLPKPLAPVLGKPFLEYLIVQLKEAGIERILLLTGYLGELICAQIGNGERFGLKIDYSQGPAEWDTGRRLAEAASKLEEKFVLMYADNLAPFNLENLWQSHQKKSVPLTITLVKKSKGNIRLNANGEIEAYDSKRLQPGLDRVEIGYMIAERDPVLLVNAAHGNGNFVQVLEDLGNKGLLGAHVLECAYNSIGDLERLKKTEEFVSPKRLILIDRDGTINERAPRGEYISKKEDFRWMQDNIEGMKQLASVGFEFIVISNQAGIGRGVVTREAVDALHAWMCSELLEMGVTVRDVFICPHHWDTPCACRKPKPGMFFEASKKYNLWLDRSIYIGDDARDAEAANNASCPCLLVGDIHQIDSSKPIAPHIWASDIKSAVLQIIEHFERWEKTARKMLIQT